MMKLNENYEFVHEVMQLKTSKLKDSNPSLLNKRNIYICR